MPNLFSFIKLNLPKKLLLQAKKVVLSGNKKTKYTPVKNGKLSRLKVLVAGSDPVQGPTLQKALNKYKKSLIFTLLVLLTVTVSFLFFIKGTDTEASWYNDNWQYRKAITIENTGSGVTDQQVKIEQDTASMISSGKLQSSCEDIRFTDKNGNLLNHRIGVAGASSSSTITYDSTNTASYTNTSNLSSHNMSHTVSSGTDTVLVASISYMDYATFTPDCGLGHVNNVTSSSVTYNGTSMSLAKRDQNCTNNRDYTTEIWYLANPDTGTHNVSFTYSEAVNEVTSAAMNFTGVDQTTVIGNSSSAQYFDTNASGSDLDLSFSTANDDATIVYASSARGDGSYTISSTSGGTDVYQLTTGAGNVYIDSSTGYQTTTTAGSQTVTLSHSGSGIGFEGVAAELIPATTAGGTTGDLCNNASTDFYVLMPEINPGDNTIYMYYGNAGATTVEDDSAFDQTTFTPNSTSAGSEAITPGPILWYKLDEATDNTCSGGTNDACDSSGQGIDGAVTGATWQPPGMCVKGTSCLYFDGSVDFVTFDSIAPLIANSDNFTIQLWFKYINDGSSQAIIGTNDSSGNNMVIVYAMDNDVIRITTDSGNNESTRTLESNRWYNMALTFDDDTTNTATVYIDGEVWVTNTQQSASFASTDKFSLGQEWDGGSNTEVFKGFIDDVKVYPYVRTQDEIIGSINGSVISQGNSSWLTNNLVGYWDLDESSGTRADSSGNGNNLSDNNTVPGVTGKFGLAADITPANDEFLSKTSNTSLQLVDNDFTLALWARVDTDTTGNLIGKYDSINREYKVDYNSSTNQLDFKIYDGATNVVGTASSSALSLNTWYFVAATYDSSENQLAISINGEDPSQASLTGTPATTTTAFVLGGNVDVGDYWYGQIDEARVYDRKLSTKEIRDLYAWAPDPVLHYKLDENTGTTSTYDSSANGYTGTLTGFSSGDWSPGVYGGALKFDGSSKYITATTEDANFSTNNYTYSAWFYRTADAGADEHIVDNRDGNTDGAVIKITEATPDTVRCEHNSSVINSTTAIDLNKWYHITCTSDGATVKLYLNGILENSTADTSAISESTDFRIGARAHTSPSQYFTGYIDDVRFYNYARTPKQIIDSMGATKANPNPNPSQMGDPVVYLKMNEGTGTVAYDSTANGNDATFVSSPTWVQSPCAYGYCLDNTSDGEYLDLGTTLTYTSTDPWSVMFWASKDTSADTGGMIAGDRADTQDFLWLNNANDVQFRNSSGTDYSFNTNSDFTVFSHYAMIYDGSGNLSLYIDGDLFETKTSVTGSFVIDDIAGAYANNVYDLDGFIDEVLIYDYAIDEALVDYAYDIYSISRMPARFSNESPVGYWKFDEGYGVYTNDTSGYGNFGTITGATWSNSGKFGRALDFDGASDQVRIPDPSGGELDPTDQLTISAWINPASDGEGSFGRIVSEVSSVSLFVQTDDNSAVSLCAQTNGPTDTCTGSDSIPLNTWTHIAVVYTDSNSRKFYINGVKVLENDSTNSLANDSDAKFIGDRSAQDRSFDGLIDEVKVYNYALTDDEIKLDYNRSAGIVFGSTSTESDGTTASNSASREYCIPGDTNTCNPPVLEYKFDENNGATSLNDTSGNGNTGTMTGFTSDDWSPGVYGSSLFFDGSADRISGTDTGSFDFGTANDITVSSWVKMVDSGTDRIIFRTLASSTNGRFTFSYENSTDSIRFALTDSTGTNYCTGDGSIDITDGEWHFVTAVLNRNASCTASDIVLYVDGVKDTTTISTATLNTNSDIQTATYWVSIDTTASWHGFLDQLRIYNYARTPAQIAWDYNKGAPVAWYKFDECEGLTAYNSATVGKDTPSGINGTITIGATGTNTDEGSCAGTSSDSWYNGATGKWGSAFSSDGTNDYIVMDADASIDFFDTAPFTESAWVKTTTKPAATYREAIIMMTDSGQGDAYYDKGLYISEDGYAGFYAYDPPAFYLVGTTDITDGNWHHIVATYDGATGKIYVDGVLENSGSLAGTQNRTTPQLVVAFDRPSTNWVDLTGLTDDVRIYNYALTAQQIKVLYNGGAVRLE